MLKYQCLSTYLLSAESQSRLPAEVSNLGKVSPEWWTVYIYRLLFMLYRFANRIARYRTVLFSMFISFL